MSGWYVKRGNQKYGPYSSTQLVEMAKKGQVLPIDWVAREEGRWMPASQMKDLFAAPPAAAARPPLRPASATPPASSALGKGPNPVAMALLSGLILLPVGHIIMGQVLKAVVVLIAAPWLMVSVGMATGGFGLPLFMLAYAGLMGTDAFLLAKKVSEGEPVGLWDTPVVPKVLGAKGILPPRIALPTLGMMLVVGTGLYLSLFGVLVALLDGTDIRNQLLIAFSLFHCVLAVIAIVLTARLQSSIVASVAAVLMMTAWGWYAFASIPPIATILGLMAGISFGAWALFTFRSPNVMTMFADAGKPGSLDDFGTPVLAGTTGGLLALILGIGGVVYMLASDNANTDYDTSYAFTSYGSPSGDREMKERTMKRREIKRREIKSRIGGTDEIDVPSDNGSDNNNPRNGSKGMDYVEIGKIIAKKLYMGMSPSDLKNMIQSESGFTPEKELTKTVNGKPAMAIYYGDDSEIIFVFFRLVQTGEWGLGAASINGKHYIIPAR